MMTRKSVVTACSGVALALLMTAGSSAWTRSKMTSLSFTGPVSLPGVTLAAGTYVFERALPDGDIHLVRISSADQRTVYLTTFTNLVDRPAGVPADRLVILGEPKAGTAPPVKAWFPMGERQGHEFIYNKH